MDVKPTPYGGDAIVRFERVQKSYDGASLVVKDLDLEVRRGEFLTLFGAVRFGQDHGPDDAGRFRDGDPR